MATATKSSPKDSMPEMPNGRVLSVKTFPSIEDAASIVPEEIYAQLPGTPSVAEDVYAVLLWLALRTPSGRVAFSQRALAAHLGCGRASISRAIDALEQGGFVLAERGARGSISSCALPDRREKKTICASASDAGASCDVAQSGPLVAQSGPLVAQSGPRVAQNVSDPSSEGMALFTSEAGGIACEPPIGPLVRQDGSMPSTCGNAADNSEKTNDDIYNKIKRSKKNLLFPHAENEDPRFPYPDVEEARNLTKPDIRYLSKMIDDAHEAGDIYDPLVCRARALLICYICSNFWDRDPMAELDMLKWQDDPEGYDSRIQSCLAENMLRWCRKLTADERAVFERIREIWPQRCYGPEVIDAERGFATEIMRGTTAEEIYELAMWYLEKYKALNGRANTRDSLSRADGSAYYLREWLTSQKNGLAATRSHMLMENMGGSGNGKQNRERNLLENRGTAMKEQKEQKMAPVASEAKGCEQTVPEQVGEIAPVLTVLEQQPNGRGAEEQADLTRATHEAQVASVEDRPEPAARADAGADSPAPPRFAHGDPEPYWWSVDQLGNGEWAYFDRHDKVTQTYTPLGGHTKIMNREEHIMDIMGYATATVGRDKADPAYCLSTPEGMRAKREWLARDHGETEAAGPEPEPELAAILDFRPGAAAMDAETDEELPSMWDLFAEDIARMGVEVA